MVKFRNIYHLGVGYTFQGKWKTWGEWTPCSKTCGKGTKKRSRSCASKPIQNGGFPCKGPKTEWKMCNPSLCIGNTKLNSLKYSFLYVVLLLFYNELI